MNVVYLVVKKEESKQNMIENINQSIATNLIDSQKQHLK